MSSALPSTQKQWQLASSGSGIDGLKLVDAPVVAPKRGQVLVRVRALSLNYRDLLIAKGGYPANIAPNVVPLSDGAGEIAAVGEDVSGWKVGDRVAGIFTPSFQGGVGRAGLEGSLGGDLNGMATQYQVLESTGVVRIPDHISFEEAATLPCAGVTAWNALTRAAQPLSSTHTVLVQGTGGVSVLAAQIALAAGARVIATSSSDEKLKRMVKLGVKAEDTINYKTTPEWGAKARELTGGRGVDHVIEVGGPGTIGQSVKALRRNGEIGVIGFVGGLEGGGLNVMEILMGAAVVRGVIVGSKEMFVELNESLTNNPELKPVVDKVFPFAQLKEALRFLETGAHFGKVVVSVE